MARQGSAAGLVKIAFELPKDDPSPHGIETVWAEALGMERYRLDNSPFYMYGVSYGDVVLAKVAHGQLVFAGVAERGGHSTYRIFLTKKFGEEDFKKHWKPFEKLGCAYEVATKRLIVIDVPPEADIYKVYKLLEDGEAAGVWDFEEGHCGHPVKKA